MDSLEKNFDLLMNASGDIMVVFGAVSGKPENAELIYDGRKRAFLRKNKEAVVPFFPIPEEAWSAINKSKDVLCIEIAEEKIVAEYTAKTEVRKNGSP
ncbi:MAG: hypothetical protein E7013_03620 [Alphaproteobacteria bacterium]|nr:hypothetical protein [Alphaproteobacteria bacterium]